MFKFAKKNVEIEEQVLEEVTDEQLGQVTGGVSGSAIGHFSLQQGNNSINVGGNASTSGSIGLNLSVKANITTPTVVADATGTLNA